jgi:Dullard-like phosphatase family protein
MRIVMDIDECMVHSVFRKVDASELKNIVTAKYSHLYCEDGAPFTAFCRPGITEYLKTINEFADVYAFTAALPIYAKSVIKHLDPNTTIFKHVWFRDSCTVMLHNDYEFYAKNLSKVFANNYEESRTLLVDNNIMSFVPQPHNGALVPDFYGDPADNLLPQLASFLELVEKESDVRPILHATYGIENKLKSLIESKKSNDI